MLFRTNARRKTSAAGNPLLLARLSVKAAAYKLGFSDTAALSRAFKRWMGISPGASRSKLSPIDLILASAFHPSRTLASEI